MASVTRGLDLGDRRAEFTLITEEITFFEAEALCDFFGGFPARIENLEEYNFVQTLSNEIDDLRGFWVGLVRVEETPGILNDLDPLTFFFVDGGPQNQEFFKQNGTFPWAENEPNDKPPEVASENEEKCVEWNKNPNNERLFDHWADFPCSLERSVLCRRDIVEEKIENDLVLVFSTGIILVLCILLVSTLLLSRTKAELNKLDEAMLY